MIWPTIWPKLSIPISPLSTKPKRNKMHHITIKCCGFYHENWMVWPFIFLTSLCYFKVWGKKADFPNDSTNHSDFDWCYVYFWSFHMQPYPLFQCSMTRPFSSVQPDAFKWYIHTSSSLLTHIDNKKIHTNTNIPTNIRTQRSVHMFLVTCLFFLVERG